MSKSPTLAHCRVYYHATSFKSLRHTVRDLIFMCYKSLIDDVFFDDVLAVMEHQIKAACETRASRRARSGAPSSGPS